MKNLIMSFVGNGLLHFGWMWFGQQCDCGTCPSFNWPARLFHFYEECVQTEEVEACWRWNIGHFFVQLAHKYFEEYL